jgi:methylthioribose-1-phosphate isomerase
MKHIHNAIWYDEVHAKILYIDQTFLPWEVKIRELATLDDAIRAIKNMEVRGAPLIGVTAAFGLYLANKKGLSIEDAAKSLKSTRPTAINLSWAVDKMLQNKGNLDTAMHIRNEEIERCRLIGEYGLPLLEKISEKKKGESVNILTHCNAGWLACVEWGTATAPIYLAHQKDIKVHVWVDETRPRNQGARLTAWELEQAGVPFTVIPDNTGGHLMKNGMVDLVLVGTDRTAKNGDVANKIGTYLKALAARDNEIPFYVAMPYSSYDRETPTGKEIPIEERDGDEIRIIDGCRMSDVGCQIIPEGTPVANYGFDITPAELISGYITEKGIKKRLS